MNNLRTVKFLVRRGALVNNLVFGSMSMLHYAAECNFESIAKYLIRKGANPSSVSTTVLNLNMLTDQVISHEVDKLMQSLHQKNFNRADYLVQKNNRNFISLIDSLGTSRETPLYWASKVNDIYAIDWLLQRGANIDLIVVEFKMNPLHVAVQSRSFEAIKLLVLRNANIRALDGYGTSCVERARQVGFDFLSFVGSVYIGSDHASAPYENSHHVNMTQPQLVNQQPTQLYISPPPYEPSQTPSQPTNVPPSPIVSPSTALSPSSPNTTFSSIEATYGGDENREDDFIPEEPKTLDMIMKERYSKTLLIGRGSNGYVYKAKKRNRTANDPSVIAVKLIDFFNKDDLNRAMRAGLNLIKLQHPHIIRIQEVCVLRCSSKTNNTDLSDKSTLCMEMDFIDTGLDSLIKKKKVLSEEMIKKIFTQIGGALKYIKEKEIVHRNIKPQNILVRELSVENNSIDTVLIGFRLSKSVSDSASGFENAGTIQYVPSELMDLTEQIEEDLQRTVYSSADVFAFGVTMYQAMTCDMVTMINGLIIKYGNEEKVLEVVRNLIKKHQSVEYSDELIDIVISMLRFKYEDRATIEEVLDKLSKL